MYWENSNVFYGASSHTAQQGLELEVSEPKASMEKQVLWLFQRK